MKRILMFFELALLRTMFPSNALTHNRPWGSLDCWEMCVHTTKYCSWTKLKFVGKNAFMNHFICNLGLSWTKVEFICKTQPWTNLFMIYGVHKASQDLFVKLNPEPICLQFGAFVNQVNICLHSPSWTNLLICHVGHSWTKLRFVHKTHSRTSLIILQGVHESR